MYYRPARAIHLQPSQVQEFDSKARPGPRNVVKISPSPALQSS